MINTLKTTLKIDMTYAINSFIYVLKKAPIFKDLIIGDEIYKSKKVKTIVRILVIILSSFRIVFSKLLYFSIIYLIANYINSNNLTKTFINIYIIMTIIGMIINNNLLNTSTKKYFSIVLFNINAKKYLKANLFFNLISNFILNTMIILSIIKNPIVSIILSILTLLLRVIGESLNILYYKRNNSLIITNYKIYWISILIGLLAIIYLSFNNIFINYRLILVTTLLLIPISCIAYLYINRIKDYKQIYKKLNPINKVMNIEQSKSYARQAMVELKDKDKYINSKKIKNKHGYSLFNTIFFERHKEILLRSSKNYSLILAIVLISITVFTMVNKSMNEVINHFLLNKISWFVIIMYFINRGAIVTQAMFYNCDHSMLTFNFYKNKKVILNVFKKRLLTLIKINLLPAISIAVFLPIIIYLTGKTTNIINYVSIPLFIIVLSIFFSTHYLVIYYLFQPYNKDMQVKSIMYTIISLLTYMISYSLTNVELPAFLFSIIGIVITTLYIIISLILVYKYAPKTFKINK